MILVCSLLFYCLLFYLAFLALLTRDLGVQSVILLVHMLLYLLARCPAYSHLLALISLYRHLSRTPMLCCVGKPDLIVDSYQYHQYPFHCCTVHISFFSTFAVVFQVSVAYDAVIETGLLSTTLSSFQPGYRLFKILIKWGFLSVMCSGFVYNITVYVFIYLDLLQKGRFT